MLKIQDTFTDTIGLLKKEKKRRQELNFNQDELIENQVWEFLYTIGFTRMNIGRECQVSYGKDNNNLMTKNIDILAESRDARLYVECTTQQDSTSKIKNWISDVEAIKKYENGNLETQDKNVVFIFFTTQEISSSDRFHLKERGISILNSKVLEYFRELIALYKNLAYYQFLAYLLNGKKIKSIPKDSFEVPAIRCKYSSKDYCFLFGIQPSKLIPLASVLHRKLNVEGDIPENYQRLVKAQKIKEIKKFISEDRGVFPTNIIISFDALGKDFFKPQGAKINDIQYGLLTLPRQYHSITVIDGQHRLFAYDGLPEANKDLIYVVAFHKLNPERQVQTFININEKQTKVSSSLMWDLYPSILDENDLKARISQIVKNLNKDKDSALNGVIQYDSAEYSEKGSKITLESICTAIKSENIVKIIEEGILGINEIKNKKIDMTYSLLKDYFNTIQELNPEHWNRKEKTNNLLRSNQGVGALIKLFKAIILYINKKNGFKDKNNEINNWFKKLLTPVNNLIIKLKTTEDIKKFKRIGEGGKQQIFIDFVKEINKFFQDFGEDIVKNIESEELENIRAELLNNGEHNTLEAKESFFIDTKRLKATQSLEKNNDEAIRGIIKTVVAFSNYKGGDIVIGLNDGAFDYIGIDGTDLRYYKNWDKLKQAISQKIKDETENLTRLPEVLRITHDSKTFAIIKVKPLDRKRFEEQDLVTLKYDNNCYKRENGDSIRIKSNDIKKYCYSVLKEMEDNENTLEDE